MGFNRDTIRRQVDYLGSIGVRIRWAGRRPKLWASVIKELQVAEEKTKNNTTMNMTMCVNYGGRAEIGDAVRQIAKLVAEGKINPDKVDERTIAKYLYQPDMPDVDLFLRPSGEQRSSNFMLWQAAYAEYVFQDTLFPDFDRTHLWRACLEFAQRDRRFGAAVDAAAASSEGSP
jgi:undecaprenyl diphosphate synthase